MTQTVLIQNLALQRAQQQLQDLQQRSPQGQVGGGSSWLGQGSPAPSYSGQSQYSAPPQYAAPAGGGGSSFLRGAAQTAAGVAAGSLAAEAIGSMFSHGGGLFGGGGSMFGGGGSGFLGGGGAAPTEEVVNNYYDSPGGSGDNFGGDNQSSNFLDPGDVNTPDDSSQFDDSNFDTGGFDGGSDDNLV